MRFLESTVGRDTKECWPWSASVERCSGYAVMSQLEWDGRWHKYYGHRLVYERVRGAIPEHMTIDHLCMNRCCCNPWHMEVVSNAENARRGALHRWHGIKQECA